MSVVHKAARDNMSKKGTAFDAAFHKAQQVRRVRFRPRVMKPVGELVT